MTAITEFVDLDRHGRVAVLTVNNPPDNLLNHGVRKGLKNGVVVASADAGVSAIVITCAGQTFISGTDRSAGRKSPQEPGLHEVLDLIEGSVKPVVAAIHGSTGATTRGSWVIRSEGAGKKGCFLARLVANRLECRFPMGRTQ